MKTYDYLWTLGNIILFCSVRVHILWALNYYSYSWGFLLVNGVFSMLGAYMIVKAIKIDY